MEDKLTQSPTPAGLELALPAEPPGPHHAVRSAYEESCKKLREAALRQLNRLISCEAKVLNGDDADAIHDMRVGSRRLQQVLDLLYPKPRHQGLRRLRRQIRRCRQVLGEVRNCDVLLEMVGRSLGRKHSTRREAWTAVQHFLRMRRSETFQQAMRKLGKLNLAALYVDLKELLHQERPRGLSAGHYAHNPEASAPSFAADLADALENTWKRFESQVEHSHRDAQPEVIHGARIATKRLRYLLEVFHEFDVAGSSDALAWLRQLQKDLGDWHDLVVLEQFMIEMLARRAFLRDHLTLAMEVGRLILRHRQIRVSFEEKYLRMSQASPEIQALKEWVSYLLASPSASLFKA